MHALQAAIGTCSSFNKLGQPLLSLEADPEEQTELTSKICRRRRPLCLVNPYPAILTLTTQEKGDFPHQLPKGETLHTTLRIGLPRDTNAPLLNSIQL